MSKNKFKEQAIPKFYTPDDFDLEQSDEFEHEYNQNQYQESAIPKDRLYYGFLDGEDRPLSRQDILKELELYEMYLNNL